MTNNSFFSFLILCEILKVAYCVSGNEPLNFFGLQLSKQTEMENPEFTKKQEKFPFEDDAVASEDRNLKKKRLFFQNGEPQTEIHQDKYFVNGEYSSKRRNNQGKAEDQQKFSEDMRSYASNYWESQKDKFPYSDEKENFGSSMEFRPMEPITGPNQRYDLEKSSISDNSQSLWNGENNFKSVNPNSNPRVGSSFSDRAFNGNINEYSGARDRNVLDRRISMTTLNEAGMRNMNRYKGDYRGNDMVSGYQMHSNMDYNKRKDDGFWNSNPYKHDKGVIINFNTECPVPRQFNNQLVHRVIVSPKSPITQSEISTYQFPGGGLISPHPLTSAYFL